MAPMKSALLSATTLGLAGIGHAGCDLDIDELNTLVGYEIQSVKTVAGWIDEDAGKVGNEDDWEGCRYDRKIIFDDGTTVVCTTYHHGSAWGKQKAVIFAKYSDQIVCIDDELMEVK
jgi:hypothetical protein